MTARKQTLIDLFENSVKKFPSNTYLLEKKESAYKGLTYTEVKERTLKLAAGLMDIGLKKGDRVALLSEGRNDWVISELAIFYNGAISVPLSVKLNEPEEIKFRLHHAGASYIIVSGGQLNKLLALKDKLPDVKKVVCIDSLVDKQDDDILNLEQLIEIGEKKWNENGKIISEIANHLRSDDYANICYTSGTTADPKGIILTHGNYITNIEQSGSFFKVPESYTTLLILPWDHAFAHTCGIYTLMKYGASLASVKIGKTPLETLKNIPVNIKEIKPVFLLSVPALAKNFKKNIDNAFRQKGGLIEKMYHHALNIAYKYNGLGFDKGKGIRKIYYPLYRFYDKLIFSKVRANFGSRLEFFSGGGALLDIELQKYFYALGMPMLQGYGLTEAAPVISSNSMYKHKMGSSGYLAPNLDLKICDDEGNTLPQGEKGEIVVRGGNVMAGYWNNEEATKETLKDGWLYTGDMGYLDKDGFLYVLGRFKSLLIADDGEKFSPEGIEEAFIEKSAFIDQCLLYNNQGPYTICLLVPSKDAIKRYVNHIEEKNEDIIIEEVLKKIANELAKYRNGGEFEGIFPQRWLPATVAVLDESFSEENKLLNSTLKMVRGKITEKHEELIQFLYTPAAKSIHNEKNKEALKRLLSK